MSIRFLKALKDKHLRGQKMLKYIKYINSAKMQNLIFAFCYNINKQKTDFFLIDNIIKDKRHQEVR